jgi:putative hydrolase of the HAD superfamily
MTNKKIVIFDLDDTLYKEIEFLKSAFSEISNLLATELNISSKRVFNKMMRFYYNKENVFDRTIRSFNSTYKTDFLLSAYRNHKPKIKLSNNVIQTLDSLIEKKIQLGLLTDGRSVQQRNKISALGLEKWFTEIIISEEFGSEKPNIGNYKHFENIFGNGQYFYVGDNVKKDFISPNALNWITICLKNNGLNIHNNQDLNINEIYLSRYLVEDITLIKSYIDP